MKNMKTVIKFLERQILVTKETLKNAKKLELTESIIHEQKTRLKEFAQAIEVLKNNKDEQTNIKR